AGQPARLDGRRQRLNVGWVKRSADPPPFISRPWARKLPPQQLLRFLHHVLAREAEVLEQLPARGRGAVAAHADERAAGTEILFPSLSHAGFDGQPRGDRRRQHAVAVSLILGVE